MNSGSLDGVVGGAGVLKGSMVTPEGPEEREGEVVGRGRREAVVALGWLKEKIIEMEWNEMKFLQAETGDQKV